jgi:hypothetical protein
MEQHDTHRSGYRKAVDLISLHSYRLWGRYVFCWPQRGSGGSRGNGWEEQVSKDMWAGAAEASPSQ